MSFCYRDVEKQGLRERERERERDDGAGVWRTGLWGGGGGGGPGRGGWQADRCKESQGDRQVERKLYRGPCQEREREEGHVKGERERERERRGQGRGGGGRMGRQTDAKKVKETDRWRERELYRGSHWEGEREREVFRGCFTSLLHENCVPGVDLLRQFYMLPHIDAAIKPASSPSLSILILGQVALALTLNSQAPGRVASRVQILKSENGNWSLHLLLVRQTFYYTKEAVWERERERVLNKQKMLFADFHSFMNLFIIFVHILFVCPSIYLC